MSVSAHRKVVTVLFCDVVGSTALGESVDPEALQGLLARYFERMQAIAESPNACAAGWRNWRRLPSEYVQRDLSQRSRSPRWTIPSTRTTRSSLITSNMTR